MYSQFMMHGQKIIKLVRRSFIVVFTKTPTDYYLKHRNAVRALKPCVLKVHFKYYPLIYCSIFQMTSFLARLFPRIVVVINFTHSFLLSSGCIGFTAYKMVEGLHQEFVHSCSA